MFYGIYNILNREVLDTLEAGRKAHSKSTFQDERFTNKKFADWIEKTKKMSEGQWRVCKKSIDTYLMGFSPLDYHAKGGKHQKNLKNSEGMVVPSTFNKKSQESIAAKQEITFNQETTMKQDANCTAKKKSIYVFTQKENSLNAEVLGCQHVILAHGSYNSCYDLSRLFGRMFPDSDVAKAFIYFG